MVSVYLECVCCKKKWSVKIDEHELHRYIGNSPDRLKHHFCCPQERPKIKPQDVYLKAVCDNCADHMHKVIDD